MRKASKNNNRRNKSLSNKKFKSEDKNLNKTNKNKKQKVAKKASVKNTIIVSNKNEIRDEVRLNKYISETGFCSRREADKLIEQGRVKIDGVKATTGMKVSKGQSVFIDGKPLKVENELVYIALNKPVGITCTTESKIKGNIVDFINHEKRIFPIGRLDKDSQGLIFMTNDGDIVNKILRAGNNHEKEYIVTVNKPITDHFIKGMSNGVPILGTVTKKCLVKKESKNSFRIILTQGLNRQIRRMCEYFGYEVKKLERIRIMNVSLGNLKMGSWRYLTKKELAEINRLTENSSKTEEASI
ncbi:23S rRNA pseudouridine(2604) synthase RluF [Clostridium perfringens]|uniref:Pseudouridine synthase n=1 Tax=Clostridium perfringens F262 TaxID=883064 RepID=A0AAV3F9J3_CLOPF|nr:23S rRNA pseudouridine(2604) synthase RluF [Clostridium perfringens]EIA16084.1 ribosomal large subunit pseudouridine synthase f [Clostridium perfringens F262]ELC8367598.1 23S rRNA pseudouridine(2604) synthase RluF [Clostridium perfringens]MBO3344193.1 23S rRNA pseudouridine(2604) synthase RluF [Clostridium perfringens]MBO3347910.1 23S rRNA pseudouridine(2604) synthase RluF [Clostridium perfringens]MBO3350521.1 23S rRNA pseudouridine(2604) synthase RluF [Clostridium perfringens]